MYNEQTAYKLTHCITEIKVCNLLKREIHKLVCDRVVRLTLQQAQTTSVSKRLTSHLTSHSGNQLSLK